MWSGADGIGARQGSLWLACNKLENPRWVKWLDGLDVFNVVCWVFDQMMYHDQLLFNSKRFCDWFCEWSDRIASWVKWWWTDLMSPILYDECLIKWCTITNSYLIVRSELFSLSANNCISTNNCTSTFCPKLNFFNKSTNIIEILPILNYIQRLHLVTLVWCCKYCYFFFLKSYLKLKKVWLKIKTRNTVIYEWS
jgi:hypothetical protein